MQINPLISVVTVCYNSEKTIARTIQSLKEQTSQNFEYIIIDGGSTDTTVDIIRKEASEFFGDRFLLISEKDDGIYDAMNKGIRQASGEFIGLLNSDDWYEVNALETVEASIKKNPEVDLIYGYIRIVKNGKEYMVRRNNYDFIMEGGGLIQHPTCFIRRSAYEEVGLYDTSYKVCADQDLILRMVRANKTYYAVDSIITNFAHGGISDHHNSVFEVLRFKKDHGIISDGGYRKSLFIAWARILFNKVIDIGGKR